MSSDKNNKKENWQPSRQAADALGICISKIEALSPRDKGWVMAKILKMENFGKASSKASGTKKQKPENPENKALRDFRANSPVWKEFHLKKDTLAKLRKEKKAEGLDEVALRANHVLNQTHEELGKLLAKAKAEDNKFLQKFREESAKGALPKASFPAQEIQRTT